MTAHSEDERIQIEARLQSYLRNELGRDDASIDVQGRAGAGDSQENWLFGVRDTQGTEHFVLRRNPPIVAFESDRGREFRLLERLEAAGLPVPPVMWLDETGRHFGRPGFTMRKCPGIADITALTANNRGHWDQEQRLALANALPALMARIHAVDWRTLEIEPLLEAPRRPLAESRLQAVLADIERHRLEPYPEIDEAVDWLKQHQPENQEPVLTHGDFRVAQLLLDEQANITALLDWEFARLSDPLEEIAHFLMPPMEPLHTIAEVWEAKDFIRGYEEASGRHVDPESLRWWRVLNMLWVLGFTLQSVRGIIDQRVNAIRTDAFNARLFSMLLTLLDS